MEITCPICKKKFEPSYWFEDNYEIRIGYTAEKEYVEDKSCPCPHCHMPVRLSELSESEQMDVQVEEMKRNNEDYEDESEEIEEE